jgi:hypothetical protein
MRKIVLELLVYIHKHPGGCYYNLMALQNRR